jgi:sugar lactone lactonase YvrE
VAGILCGALGGGCHSTSPPAAPSFNAAPAATTGDFRRPSDAVPNADGTVFYFTANGSPDSEAAGVYSVAATGGAVTTLASGTPLASPFGIALGGDDATLYVSDPGSYGPADETGQLFSLQTSGGTPTSIAGTLGTRPRSLHVQFGQAGQPDQIFFTGVDPNDGTPGLFQIPAGGGALTTIAKGDPFRDPSGVVVTKAGDAYVIDASGDEGGSARVLRVQGGVATELVSGLGVGFPAGVAMPIDESAVLVSGIDPVTGFAIVYAVDVATKGIATFNKGIEGNLNSAGLHRARNKNVFSWADSTAGEESNGIVFRVELK